MSGKSTMNRCSGSLTMARKDRMQALFPQGEPPLLWCPVLAHYTPEGTLDKDRMFNHQNWLVQNGVTGFLVPGSTSDAWEMDMPETLDFLNTCQEIAAKIRVQTPGVGKAPYLLGGALKAGEDETIQAMDMMMAAAPQELFGFCVCPPRGIQDEHQMERALSQFLGKGIPCAVYQLPQVTQVTMPADMLRRLADEYDTFLFFKDSSGKDGMAQSGIGLDGVFMVRGAEGKYAEWLADPIPSGYHGFLLSTANVYPGQLTSLIEKVSKGASGGDLIRSVEISKRVSKATEAAFGMVTNDPKVAEEIGGNAFTNSAKLVDFWMAWGPDATKMRRPLPLLRSGKRLPLHLIERMGKLLKAEGLLPKHGYNVPRQAVNYAELGYPDEVIDDEYDHGDDHDGPLKDRTVKELRQMLKSQDLPTAGKKAILVQRLLRASGHDC